MTWRGWVSLAALLTAAATVAALGYTAGSLKATQDQIEISEQGQITERFGRAVDQLGSASIDTRLGGIFALVRLASDSPRDLAMIIEVIAAYVRVHAPIESCDKARQHKQVAVDIQAALYALGHINKSTVAVQIDLSRSCLSNTKLISGDYSDSQFDGSDLSGVLILDADLSWSSLNNVRANCALINANLRYSNMADADFSNSLISGDFFRMQLFNVNLRNSQIGNFDSSDLSGAVNWPEGSVDSSDFRGASIKFGKTKPSMSDNIGLDDAQRRNSRVPECVIHRAFEGPKTP